jgi:protein N-terminal amidase
MALKYECVVTVGYPEKADIPSGCYYSAIIVNADGETIANYRKIFLHSDGAWVLEGPDGFYHGVIPDLGNVAMGIYKWQTTDCKSETSLTIPAACYLTFNL